jgi:hypothetical protein
VVITANTPFERQEKVVAVRGVLCAVASSHVHPTPAFTPMTTMAAFARSFDERDRKSWF